MWHVKVKEKAERRNKYCLNKGGEIMWKYNYTDEMFNNHNDELYHSDVYLGEDYSNGIKHYMYVKREKMPNGKWKYYYSDVSLTGINKYAKMTGKKNSRYGTYVKKKGNDNSSPTLRVKKGNSLFTKNTTSANGLVRTQEVGKAVQTYDDVKRKVKNSVNKAKDWLIINGIYTPEEYSSYGSNPDKAMKKLKENYKKKYGKKKKKK